MFGIFKRKKEKKPEVEPQIEEQSKLEEKPEEQIVEQEVQVEEQIEQIEQKEEEVQEISEPAVEEVTQIEEKKEEVVQETIAEEEPVQVEEVKEEIIEEEKPKLGFLAKTLANIKSIVPQRQEKIEFDVIEEMLIEADMEYEIVEKAMDGLPEEITRAQLRHRLVMLFEHAPEVDQNFPKPFTELIIGVNGAGKTTTIAKLANLYKKNGETVMLGAGDTFRAAAIEQLTKWSERLDVPIIKTQQGHDPSAVAYDAISSAVAKNMDHVIIDTAGRLQTQTNLSNELKKIVKVCNKAKEGTPHQKIMILDGTQGNTAIAQARAFHEMVGVDGIIVTKLDGTAKGGALFSISNRLELPIFYVGTGESADDLMPFSPDDFVDSLLDTIYV